MGTKKNFVLDTNVILHDYKCLENFQENDLYIPIVVLEELDKFKKGSEQINYNAREFVRQLDALTDNDMFKKGADLGTGLGKLFIMATDHIEPEVSEVFQERIPDHKILSAAIQLIKNKPKTHTILITKDINLRMKARALGIPTEDYINDKVTNVDIFEREEQTFTNVTKALTTVTYTQCTTVDTVVVCQDVTVGLFDSSLYDYFWNYDNNGLKLAQLRFYEIPTNVN